MRLRYLFGLALSQLALAGAAFGDSEAKLGFDTIFDLPFVYSLEFGPDGKELFVSVEGHLLQWELEPLRLTHHQETQIIANEMMLGPNQQLYSVGVGWGPNSFGRAGSVAVAYARNSVVGGLFEEVETNSNLGISEYSSVAFDSVGTPILVSAGSFTASPFPRRGDIVNGNSAIYPQLKFQCGGATQLSIFQINGLDHYIASTASAATLEFGKLKLGEEDTVPSDCFTIQQAGKEETRLPTFDSLRHAVIDLGNGSFVAEGTRKAVMVLNPNTNKLHMFRIEPYGDKYFLSRRGALEVDLTSFLPVADRKVVMTSLSLDSRAREIHVSSNAANVVLRFEFDGSTLRSRGRFALSAPVQKLKMSADGSAAAIVTGREPFGGDWRIVVIANPSSLSDWLQIPISFPSVRDLQQSLNDRGILTGFPDGILGPQTTTAIDTFWRQSAEDSDPAISGLEGAIVSTFPKYVLQQELNAPKN